MKKILPFIFSLFIAHSAMADAVVGQSAPDFSLKNAAGKTVKLSDYKDKIVVLEWTNPNCPFVKKFYDSDTMQKLQADAQQKGVVWLSINSSAKGKEGHVDGDGVRSLLLNKRAKPAEYLLDAEGTVGHLYGAKTTPHMFVIDAKGLLAYAGAIDDKPTPKRTDLKDAHNYVTAALDALLAGKSVEMRSTQPYGCNVKY